MKNIEEILKTPGTYLWDDNHTIDCCVNKNTPFIEILHEFKCLACDGDIMTGNEDLYDSFTDTINGININCKHCNQEYFIRKPFAF